MSDASTEITYKSSVYTSNSSNIPLNVPGKVWVETDKNDEVSTLKVFGPRNSNKWEVITSKVDDSKLSSNIPSSIQGESNKVVNVVNCLYDWHIAENSVSSLNTIMGSYTPNQVDTVVNIISAFPDLQMVFGSKATITFSVRGDDPTAKPVYITTASSGSTFDDVKTRAFEIRPGQTITSVFNVIKNVKIVAHELGGTIDIIVLVDYVPTYKEPIMLRNTDTGNWHQITIDGARGEESLYIGEPISSNELNAIQLPTALRLHNSTTNTNYDLTIEGEDINNMSIAITPISELS